MILSPTQTLEVVLESPITTNDLPIVVAWASMQSDASTLTPQDATFVTNDTTPVEIVGEPAASTRTQLKYLSICNEDTVDAVVIVQVNDNGITRRVAKVTLLPDYRLEYTPAGFRAFDETGATLGIGAPGVDGIDGTDGVDGTVLTFTSTTSASTSYALAASDHMKRIRFSAATTVTVTVNTAVIYDGFYCEVIQDGAGQVVVVAGGGMTQKASATAKSRALYSAMGIAGYSTTAYYVGGDQAAS